MNGGSRGLIGLIAGLMLLVPQGLAAAQPSGSSQPTEAELEERVRAWLMERLTEPREFDLTNTMWRWRETILPVMTDEQFQALERRVSNRPEHPEQPLYQMERAARTPDESWSEYSLWIGEDGSGRVARSSPKTLGVDHAVGEDVSWRLVRDPSGSVDGLTLVGPEEAVPAGFDIHGSLRTALRGVRTFRAGIFAPRRPLNGVRILDIGLVENDRWAATVAIPAPGATEEDDPWLRRFRFGGGFSARGAPLLDRSRFMGREGRIPPSESLVTDRGLSDGLGHELGNDLIRAYRRVDWSLSRASGDVTSSDTPQTAIGYELLEARRIEPKRLLALLEPPRNAEDLLHGPINVDSVADFRGSDGRTGKLLSTDLETTVGVVDAPLMPTKRAEERQNTLALVFGGGAIAAVVGVAAFLRARRS